MFRREVSSENIKSEGLGSKQAWAKKLRLPMYIFTLIHSSAF